MDWENVIFYLFSTIAQVVATLMALYGAFYVFRIEHILNTIIGRAQAYLIEYERNKKVRKADIDEKKGLLKSRIEKAIARRDVPDVVKQIEDLVSILPTPSFKKGLKNLLEYKTIYDDFKKSAVRVIVISSVVLSISIICLVINPYVRCGWHMVLALFGVLMGLANVLWIACKIRTTINKEIKVKTEETEESEESES